MVLSTAATPPARPEENRPITQTKTVLRTFIIYRPSSLIPVALFRRFSSSRSLPILRQIQSLRAAGNRRLDPETENSMSPDHHPALKPTYVTEAALRRRVM